MNTGTNVACILTQTWHCTASCHAQVVFAAMPELQANALEHPVHPPNSEGHPRASPH